MYCLGGGRETLKQKLERCFHFQVPSSGLFRQVCHRCKFKKLLFFWYTVNLCAMRTAFLLILIIYTEVRNVTTSVREVSIHETCACIYVHNLDTLWHRFSFAFVHSFNFHSCQFSFVYFHYISFEIYFFISCV